MNRAVNILPGVEPYPAGAVLLAPLSGYTDLPYRESAYRHACCYAFTEMVDAGSLFYGTEKTLRFLERGEGEAWLGVQLLGENERFLSGAVKILNDYAFDLLDFNLGCPAPKVVKKQCGAALGAQVGKAIDRFSLIVAESSFPVSAKIRILDEFDPEPTLELAKGLESSGAVAITIHGRVKSAFYSGPVRAGIIRSVAAELGIPVIANGGVVDHASAENLRLESGCSRIMLARGAMGNPWLFRELADPVVYKPPTVAEFAEELETHILAMIDYYGEEIACRMSRKIIHDYLRGRGFANALRSTVSEISTRRDLSSFICEIRKGPAHRYRSWLKGNPDAPRRLLLD